MKRLLLLAMSAILLTVCVKAQQTGDNSGNPADSSLVVCLKDGSQKTFLLKQSPKIKFEGENVTIEASATQKYAFGDIRKMTFIPKEKLKGDVNGDKVVNMADVNKVVSLVMAGSYEETADVNNDKQVNAADIVEVINAKEEQSSITGTFIENASRRLMARTRAGEADETPQGNSIRIFLNTGEIVDMDAAKISNITFTTKQQTVIYRGISHNFEIEAIDSVWYISPSLRITTTNLDFGKVATGSAKTMTATMVNSSNYQEYYTILTDGVFTVDNPYQEMVVMAGQAVSIDLIFTPTAVGVYNSTLSIASSSAAGGKLDIPVMGEGVGTFGEEVEAVVEPVDDEIIIALTEDEVPASLSDFKVSNFYGEFPVKVTAAARGLNGTRQSGDSQYACTANVPVSSNGLQFHSFIDGFGNPWMFSISLPSEKPEISFTQTAISLLMSTPDLMTSNEAQYRNTVKFLKSLDSFDDLVSEVRRVYNEGKNHNLCPDFSGINVTPIFNELYNKTKDTRELTLSGVSLKDLTTTPESAKFRLHNDMKRCILAYIQRLKINEANAAPISQEEATPTIIELCNQFMDELTDDVKNAYKEIQETRDEILRQTSEAVDGELDEQIKKALDEKIEKAEAVIKSFNSELDYEIIELIDDFRSWVQEIEDETIAEYPELGSLFHLNIPYNLKSKGVDYMEVVGDFYDITLFNKQHDESVFEVESGMIEVPFKDSNELYVNIYGMGSLGDKSWKDYTKEDQHRIIFALMWGAYVDFIEPVWKGITGIKKAQDAYTKDFKLDLRYCSNDSPVLALVTKLYRAFIKDKKNVVDLALNFSKGGDLEDKFWAVTKQLAKFSWDQIKTIPKEVEEEDKFDWEKRKESKRTYINLIYKIFRKYSRVGSTPETFRKYFKTGTISLLRAYTFVTKWMSISEKGVDLLGAVTAVSQSQVKETHHIKISSEPYVVIKEPTTCYLTHDVEVHFEWETYKGNIVGEFQYDLEMMTETPTGINQVVVLPDIVGTSCDFNLNELAGAKDAMKIYFRIVAHSPEYKQVHIITDFFPLVWRATEEAPEMIDMGLPSGTLWAKWNLGAKINTDFGNYYAWGETDTKDAFSWGNYKYSNNGQQNSLTKYNTKSYYGKVDNKTQLDATDDRMKAKCGYYYAIPTRAEWQELLDNCSYGYRDGAITLSGPHGEGPILLPYAGYRSGMNLYDDKTDGYYWSSTLDRNSPDDAWFVHFAPGKHEFNSYYRSQGRCIRPVMRKANYKKAVDVRKGVNSTK